jgi:hypothetical protein
MRQHLKKYLIEFVVIFVSISLSFIVDEWRTSEQEDKIVKEYLQKLKIELAEKTLHTKQYLNNNRSQILVCERLAANFITKELTDDSLFLYLEVSEHADIFESELVAWESLKNSGAFSSIKPEIADSVNSLIKKYKKLEITTRFLQDLAVRTWPEFLPDIPSTTVTNQWISVLQREGFLLSIKQSKPHVQGDMSKFLNNSVAVDYFFTKNLAINRTEKDFKSLPEIEKRLIELIEKELNE